MGMVVSFYLQGHLETCAGERQPYIFSRRRSRRGSVTSTQLCHRDALLFNRDGIIFTRLEAASSKSRRIYQIVYDRVSTSHCAKRLAKIVYDKHNSYKDGSNTNSLSQFTMERSVTDRCVQIRKPRLSG